MKHFTQMQVDEAIAYAAQGGQALHTHRIIVDYDKAPACFINAIERGEDIAHLFDQDARRLIETCRELGVNKILIERRGQPGQHIDLCGAPLRKAMRMCRQDANKQESLFSE